MAVQLSGAFDRSGTTIQHRPLAAFIFAAVGLLAILCPWSTANAAHLSDEWIIDCVDCPPYFGHVSPRGLQVDGAGELHVVYGAEHLYHAWTEADSWRTETVDSTLNVGRRATLAIGQDDGLHVLYQDEGSQALRYASHGGAGWQIEEIAKGLTGNAYPTIALDPAGHVHVAYFHANSGELRYGHQNGDSWLFELVDDAGAGRGVSLAVDDQGVPHLGYTCDGTCYAVKEATGWRLEQVVSDGPWLGDLEWFGDADPTYTSLALDEGGYPHIALTHGPELIHATRNAAGWQTDAVDWEIPDFADIISDCTLVLDESGEPHISYAVGIYPPKGGPFLVAYYAAHKAGQWSMVEIGDGSPPTLTLQQASAPHIVYAKGMVLHHAFQRQSSWQTDVVDQGGEAGRHAALALDAVGRPRIVSLDSPNGIVRYAEWDGEAWQVEPLGSLFAGMDVFGPLGHATDRHDATHVVTEVGTVAYPIYNTIGYAHRGRNGWQYSVPWPFGAADMRGLALALDSLGSPHISLATGYGGDYAYLYYAYLNATGEWMVEEINLPSGDWSVDQTTLALDRSDSPRIAYAARDPSGDHDLRFARKAADGWHFETVDSRGDVGSHLSLALDGADRPHMSYYDATNGDLSYAVWDGDDWGIELVDRETDVGQYTSLAIAGQGIAHISYYNATDGNLKYAHQDENGWQIKTVDDAGDVGQYSSLALYGQHPSIGYYDRSRHDLKVARLPFLPTDFQYLPLIGKAGVD